MTGSGIRKDEIILKKRRLGNLIKIAGFAAGIILLLAMIFPIFNYKNMGGGGGFTRLYESPSESIDAMFFGSSRAHCTIDHGYLWEQYGIAGFTLSAGSQQLDSTYYCLQEALRCQSPKVVFVEISQINNGTIQNNEADVYRNYLGMRFSNVSLSFAKYLATQMEMSREEMQELILKFPIIHSRYRELEKADFQDSIPFMRGYRGSFDVAVFDTPQETQMTMEISEDNKAFIEKIITLTKERNVSLVLFASPYVVSEEDQMRMNEVGVLAAQYEIPFINFNHLYEETGIDYERDFRDESHVNNYGAMKVTEYLAQYMRTNYNMEDHRGDNNYFLWEQNAEYLRGKDFKHELEQSADINEYLTKLSMNEDYLVLIQFVGNYQALGDAYLEGLAQAGLMEADYQAGGSYVLFNGNKLSELPENIYIDSNNSIWIQGKEYQTGIENGVNIVVYDAELQQIIDVAGDDIYLGLELSHIELEENCV